MSEVGTRPRGRDALVLAVLSAIIVGGLVHYSTQLGDDELAKVRFDVQFYEEVRIYMAKFDADERRANGEPIPEEIQLLLSSLIAESTDPRRQFVRSRRLSEIT